MSLPMFSEVRNRIENIEDIDMKRLFQTVYLFGLRIGEACGYRYPSETKSQPTGMLLWATEETWQIPDEGDDETITLLTRIMARNYGKVLTDNEVLAIKEPAFILSVVTEKREGFNRKAAIPLNPDYEPWAKEVMQYIMERQIKGPLPYLKELTKKLSNHSGKPVGIIEAVKTIEAQRIIKNYPPVFPFRRQEIYPIAVEIFEGFTYPIVKYNKLAGTKIDEKGEETNVYETVPDHQKKYSSHANRHERSTELKSIYRIKGDPLNQFMGWARGRGSEASAMQDRYILEPWREAGYFPKLLRKRN